MVQKDQKAQLLFHQGLHRLYDTQVAPGSARRLINWEPTPDGGLRTRRKWVKGTTLGAPATRKIKTIGHMSVFDGYETPIRRQMLRRRKRAQSTGVSYLEREWWRPTVQGSFLLAFLVYSDHSHVDGVDNITITAPAGWTELTGAGAPNNSMFPIEGPGSPPQIKMRVYYIIDAAAREGAERWTFDSGGGSHQPRRAQLYFTEWRGISRTSPIDIVKTNSGTSGAPDTDLAPQTTEVKELAVGMLAALTAEDSLELETPTSGWYDFRFFGDDYNIGFDENWLDAKMYRNVLTREQITRLQAAYQDEEDLDATAVPWVAGMLTLKARQRGDGEKDHIVPVHEDDADTWNFYEIDPDQVDTDTYTSIGTLAHADQDHSKFIPAMAEGLGGMLITLADMEDGAGRKNLYQWDGDLLIPIFRSPPARTVAFHQGRFFAGGTKENPNRLYYSDYLDQTTWGDDSWLPIGEDAEPIVDCAPVSGGLLIAKQRSLWFLLGTGPRSFSLQQLDGGTGMKGRCICPVPGGAFIAGRHHIWAWSGGVPQIISRGLDDWWSNAVEDGTRTFVHSAYQDGKAYFSVGSEDTQCVYDLEQGIWWTDQPSTKGLVASFDDRHLYFCPSNSNEWAPVNYQLHPGGARARDDVGTVSYEAWTQELMVGTPGHVTVPRWLYIAIQKENFQTGHNDLTVTPVYDGVAQTPRLVEELHPRSGRQLGNGDHRLRLDIGVSDSNPVHKVQFKFEYDAPPGNTTTLNLEYLEYVYDVQELWG